MDSHDQQYSLAFRPNKMSLTHDSSPVQTGSFPQSQSSDAKLIASRTQLSLTDGAKKKVASLELVSRPKPSHPRVIPSYTYASKYPQSGKVEKTLTRQIARGTKFKHAESNKLLSEARRGKTTKQPADDEIVIKHADALVHPCQITEIPASMFTLKVAPTQKSPFYFSGVVSGYSTLETYYVNGEEKPAFLDQPIASGDWEGALVSLRTREGRISDCFHFFGKVTWAEFLARLHACHPTGTSFDFDEEENDRAGVYWEYFDIEGSLLMGSKVE